MVFKIRRQASRPGIVGVVGGGSAAAGTLALAEELGAGIARIGCVLITGGGGGVMAAASRGADRVGGLVIGILPQNRGSSLPGYPNEYVHVPVYTGMSDARNVIVSQTPDVVVALEGSFGTLSEIALARKAGVPVISLACPAYDAMMAGPGYLSVKTVQEAIAAVQAKVSLITKQ